MIGVEQYTYFGIIPAELVFPHVIDDYKRATKIKVPCNGEEIKISFFGRKLISFKNNPNCVVCGTKGTQFLVCNRFSTPNRMNRAKAILLVDNNFVLMTIDHVIPKSMGGSGELNNRQTMCKTCNNWKSTHSMEQIASEWIIG